MNAKEGMRRLGILLGVVGGTICGFYGASAEQELLRARAAHKKFESLMGLPAMKRVTKAVKDYLLIPPPPPSFVPDRPARIYGFKVETDFDGSRVAIIHVDSDGIKKVNIDTQGTVSSFELLTGAWVHRTESPGPQEYLVPLLYPFVGFLVPWGAVRVLTWVGTGFFNQHGDVLFAIARSLVGNHCAQFCAHPLHRSVVHRCEWCAYRVA